MATEPDDSGRGAQRPNPSVESTKIDDAQDRKRKEDAAGVGAGVGLGAGCLGMTLLPWVMVGLGLVAAVVVAAMKGWFR